jgi:hypothetical protein
MKKIAGLLFMALGLPVMLTAHANTDVEIKGNEVSLQDDIIGVEVKLDPSGKLLSAISSYSHPVDFPDRRGINKAYIIAEEKAKAQLVRFVSQEVTTSRVVNEIDNAVENASRQRGDKGSSWSKSNAREIRESLTEMSGSNASGTLRGLRILSKEYNEKAEEVTVIVGLNKQSQSAAGQLGSSGGASKTNSSDFPSVNGESRKARDFQEFR